jgi:hypothetical protein
MESGKRLDLYRELYAREVERQNTLTEGVNGIITVATILGGAIVFLLRDNPSAAGGVWLTVFQAALGIATVLLMAALALLTRAWTGSRFRTLPDAKEIEGWWREMERYDLLFPPDEYDRGGVPAAAVRFEITLLERYVEAAQFNQRANERTGSFAQRSKIALSWAALALAVAMFPHYLQRNPSTSPSGGRHAGEEKENPTAASPASAHGAVALRK